MHKSVGHGPSPWPCGSVAATDESLFSSNATSHGNAHIVSYPHRPWYPTALASTTHTTSRRARLACHGSNVTEKLYSRRSLDIHTEPAPFATAWHCGESGLGSLMQCCATAAAAHRSSSSRRRREWLCAKPILKGELGWAVRAADVFHEPQPVDAQAGAQWVWFGRRVRPASDREAAWRGCTVSRDAARRHASAHRLCPLPKVGRRTNEIVIEKWDRERRRGRGGEGEDGGEGGHEAQTLV